MLFVDNKRGNFHAFYHVYETTVTDECVDSLVSAHIFSLDGINWVGSKTSPYTTQVRTTGEDSPITVSTRERPKLFFNEDGVPLG